MAFTNPVINLTDVPQLDEAAFVPLDPGHLRVRMIGHAVFVAVIVAVCVGLSFALGWIPLLIMGILLAFVVLSAVLARLEVKHIAWQVREHDLSYRSGVIVRTVETIPFVRIQHARIRRGPIQQRFGLATLEINSAGPDLSISGLSTGDAERLKHLVIERAGELSEDTEAT